MNLTVDTVNTSVLAKSQRAPQASAASERSENNAIHNNERENKSAKISQNRLRLSLRKSAALDNYLQQYVKHKRPEGVKCEVVD